MEVLGQQGIADMFGVSRETIDNWQTEGMPVEARGGPGVPSRFDSVKCIRWLIEREVKKVQNERPQDRLARLQADRIEMELLEKRGALIPAAQLEPRLKSVAIAAREYWRNEPARLSRELHGKSEKEVEEMLSSSFDKLLLKLSSWGADGKTVEIEEGDDE